MEGREDQAGQVRKGGMAGVGRAGQSARKGRPGRQFMPGSPGRVVDKASMTRRQAKHAM